MIMIEHIKMIAILYLDILSILLSEQLPHRINSSHLFRNLEDPDPSPNSVLQEENNVPPITDSLFP